MWSIVYVQQRVQTWDVSIQISANLFVKQNVPLVALGYIVFSSDEDVPLSSGQEERRKIRKRDPRPMSQPRPTDGPAYEPTPSVPAEPVYHGMSHYPPPPPPSTNVLQKPVTFPRNTLTTLTETFTWRKADEKTENYRPGVRSYRIIQYRLYLTEHTNVTKCQYYPLKTSRMLVLQYGVLNCIGTNHTISQRKTKLTTLHVFNSIYLVVSYFRPHGQCLYALIDLTWSI